jgi:hypothetical protein
MVEKRTKRRRQFIAITRFPLSTQVGDPIVSERRRLPSRRLNDIDVKEITYADFFSEFLHHN